MKQTSSFFILLFFLDISFASSQTPVNLRYAHYGIYDTDSVKPQEYQHRRAAVIAMMDSGSVAVFRANDPVHRNGDNDYKFRQNDNIFYLTGCNETNSTLILAPNGIRIDSATIVKEIFFVREYTKSWRGNTLGLGGAKQVLGFGVEEKNSVVLPAEKLKYSLLHTLIT
jgi:Xaa-Pro aminopeptidase